MSELLISMPTELLQLVRLILTESLEDGRFFARRCTVVGSILSPLIMATMIRQFIRLIDFELNRRGAQRGTTLAQSMRVTQKTGVQPPLKKGA